MLYLILSEMTMSPICFRTNMYYLDVCGSEDLICKLCEIIKYYNGMRYEDICFAQIV